MTLLLAVSDEVAWRVVAAIGGSIITVLGGFLLAWWNRGRPKQVKVRETQRVSLLRIAKSVRPHIQVTLKGKPIQNLSAIELAVTNGSYETIKDIILKAEFPSN